MEYELAKELKDAGFPQTEFEVFCKHGCPPFNKHEESRPLQCGECHLADLVYFPTLEELIEACGDGYFDLERSAAGWRALKGGVFYSVHCKTPTEAVARLWLALNKKA